MIVRPKEETPKLGRKNIDAKTAAEAFDVYRKRFAPLADDIELIVEGDDGDQSGPSVSGVVEVDASSGTTDSE